VAVAAKPPQALSPIGLIGRGGLDPCSELQQSPEIVGVSPCLVDLAVGDSMNKGCGERLRLAVTGDPKEALLATVVRCAHDDLVLLGDDVVDRPPLLDRAEA